MQKQHQNFVNYTCASHVRWAVTTHGIILVDQSAGSNRLLSYPEAAVWDLITRDFSYTQTVRMLCAIASMKVDEANRFILESLEDWAEDGFLVKR